MNRNSKKTTAIEARFFELLQQDPGSPWNCWFSPLRKVKNTPEDVFLPIEEFMLAKAAPYVKQFVKIKGVNRRYKIVKDFLDNVPYFMAEAFLIGIPDMLCLMAAIFESTKEENEKENIF